MRSFAALSVDDRARRRRLRRRLLAAALLVGLFFSIERPERAIDGPRDQRVYLIDYGFHTGLAIERRLLTARGLFLDLPPSEWIEIGWGDEVFYRETASFWDFNLLSGLRALAGLGETTLHAVALPAPPDRAFQPGWATPIFLDRRGAALLAAEIDRSLSRPAQPLGDGHWPGASRFYRSGLTYGPTQLCNHWVSNALNKAGLPSSSFWSTLPFGLLWELRLRD